MHDLNTCGECAQHLEGLAIDDHDPSLQLTVVTGAGRVSVSRRLLQLLSPLVREAVASLPVLATLEPITIILPDTDTSTVNMVMDLLVTGKTSVDSKEYQVRIVKLAECLQIDMQNLSLDIKSPAKIRVRKMSEILKPGFNFNNNSNGSDGEDGKVIQVAVGFGKYESFEASGSVDSAHGMEGNHGNANEKYQHESVTNTCRKCGERFRASSFKIYCHTRSRCMNAMEFGKYAYANVEDNSACEIPPPQFKIPDYPTMIRSALRSIVPKKEFQKSGPSRETILNYMFVNYDDLKRNKNFLFGYLKKMVASKELILTSMNGIPCYKLSDAVHDQDNDYISSEVTESNKKFGNVSDKDENISKSTGFICHYYTDIIKSALQSFVLKKKNHKHLKSGPPRNTLLQYMYSKYKVSKKDKKHVYAALKQMAASMELIETSMNGDLYYKLSDN